MSSSSETLPEDHVFDLEHLVQEAVHDFEEACSSTDREEIVSALRAIRTVTNFALDWLYDGRADAL